MPKLGFLQPFFCCKYCLRCFILGKNGEGGGLENFQKGIYVKNDTWWDIDIHMYVFKDSF
jgi:hypothetical protein